MIRTFVHRTLALLAAAASLAPAAAAGPIGTLPRGAYLCELPGDAAGPAGISQPETNFTIESASRYVAGADGGTYLRRGKAVVMSSGPRQGESYVIGGTSFLRRVEEGQPSRLRCVRTGNETARSGN